MRWEMRFFFSRKGKKTFLSTQQEFFALSFLRSLSLSFSLSLSAQTKGESNFWGEERDCLFCRCSFAVFVSRAAVSSRISALSLFFCVSLRVSFKRKWRGEKRTEEKKDQLKTDLFFFLCIKSLHDTLRIRRRRRARGARLLRRLLLKRTRRKTDG